MIQIASRTLKIVEGDTERSVVIRLFIPEEDGPAWKCMYEIGWPEKIRTFNAFGNDAFQAIELAMQLIGAELYASEYHAAGTLGFDAPGSGYGFPVAKTLRDILVGDDKAFYA